MLYHQTLDLPPPLVKETIPELFDLKNTCDDYYKLYTDINKFLTPELIATLSAINLHPDHFMVFGTKNKKLSATRVHSDVLLYQGNWINVPIAINWELTPGTCRWTWWDTSGQPPIYPPIDNLQAHPNLPIVDGLTYNKDDPYDTKLFTCLDTYTMPFNQAVLVRADAPHKINYISTVENRMCLSLRLKIDRSTTWENTLDKLQSLFCL